MAILRPITADRPTGRIANHQRYQRKGTQSGDDRPHRHPSLPLLSRCTSTGNAARVDGPAVDGPGISSPPTATGFPWNRSILIPIADRASPRGRPRTPWPAEPRPAPRTIAVRAEPGKLFIGLGRVVTAGPCGRDPGPREMATAAPSPVTCRTLRQRHSTSPAVSIPTTTGHSWIVLGATLQRFRCS